jgi:putative copper export protein
MPTKQNHCDGCTAEYGGSSMTSVFDVVMTIHTIFAALWTGGTLIVAGAVIPAARRELLDEGALALIGRRFWYLTIASVLLLLFSGGHLAATLYTAETLQSTGSGQLVLTMVGLWLVLAVVLLFGFRRLTGSSSEKSAVASATKARPWFLGASVVSIALLVVAGLL